MKPRKASWVLFLAFLLLSLQLEARVHPLGHLGERLRAAAEQGAAVGLPTHCAECDLLSGGVDVPQPSFERPVFAGESVEDAPAGLPSPATGAFFPYSSRAPPVLR